MKFFCTCTIKLHAEATCVHRINVPTFKTYPDGYHGQTESKSTDSVLQFCANGLRWCPHQESAASITLE